MMEGKNPQKKLQGVLFKIRNNGIIKATVGFICFLITAAVIMLLVESTETGSGINDFFHSLWFSVVTVTTVGYGDLSPLSKMGKVAAAIIMFIGIVYSGILTGNITSWLVERNVKKAKGFVPLKGLKEHILILGWQADMGRILKNLILVHKTTANNIALVNNIDSDEINELRQDPVLREIHYLNGDYTNAKTLSNACGEHARKVLILANERSTRSDDEVDFHTVLATIAIAKINPNIFFIVEIVQPKFSLYLQHIKVNEIVLNRLYARALMCNIGLMSGTHNLIKRLFNMRDGLLRIEPALSNQVGLTYRELREQTSEKFIIGVLENTGSLNKRKREKMTLLQKSSTITEAIQELKSIKQMKSKVPIFHPPPNYRLKENSAIIFLDVKHGDHFSLQKKRRDKEPEREPQKIEEKKKKGVLFICGWKPQLLEMIDFILKHTDEHDPEWEQIRVIATVSLEKSENFRRHFSNQTNVSLYRGDYIDREVLLSAGIRKATKVMILGETHSGKTFEEIDAQTVLAAMIISDLNKQAYKVAEILDKRYREALEQANVEEIVPVDDLFRIMLVHGALGAGVAHVLRKLINFESTQFEVRTIEKRFVGKTFEELMTEAFTPEKLILGLLEDTGNLYARKSEMIREAQFQPNIRASVENLKKVKGVMANQVIICPEKDHKIDPHTKLVLLKTSDIDGWKRYLVSSNPWDFIES